MLIYQVLDEQNRPIGEYNDLDYALHNAQSLTLWHTLTTLTFTAI